MTLESAGAGQATLKSNFIKNLQWFAGQHPYQQISAQWIESRLGGSDWAARINSPNVTLKLESHAYGQNTMYMPANNGGNPSTTNGSVEAYSENGSALSIVIYVNGVVFDAVKVDCGNMVGSWRALPPPNQPPTGSFISLVCNAAAETYTISVRFSDPDAATSAQLRNAANNQTFFTANGTSATWTIPTKTLVPGDFPVGLWVRDTGPSGPNTYTRVATHALANCNPQGSVAATSCDQVNVKAWDPNEPSKSLKFQVSVNGGGKFTTSPSTVGGQGASVTVSVLNAPNFDPWKKNNAVTLYVTDGETGTQVNVASTTTNAICDSLSCNGNDSTLALDPNLVAGEQTHIQVWVTVSGPGPNGKTVGPPGAKFTSIKFDTLNTSSGYTVTGSDLYSASIAYTPQTAGSYDLSWTFGGGESNPPSVTCSTKNIKVAYKPYFSVLGGDVSAGEGFGGSCKPESADIAGSNNPANKYFGASSSQGALATGKISQFATDTTNNLATSMGGSTDGLATHQPSGLAFANSPPSSAYGGNFLGSPFPASPPKWCVPDYAKSVTAPANAPGIPGLGGLTQNANGYVYRVNGDHTISGFTLQPGVHVTLIVTGGDVFINGDIDYASYFKLTDIPQFTLIVQPDSVGNGGNIYIGAGVQNLHGFYAAQPDAAGNGGIMYTCATSLGNESTDYGTCNQQLNFYGAVAAGMIVPGRTLGNVAQSAVPTDPAEQFVFSPELWLGSISNAYASCAVDPAQVSCMYQSYTSLPPVL